MRARSVVPSAPTTPSDRNARYSRFIPPAPTVGVAIAYLAVASVVLGLLAFYGTARLTLLLGVVAVFFLPGLLALLLTPPVAAALGGRLSLRRSALLALVSVGLAFPFLAVWRLLVLALPGIAIPGVVWVILIAEGASLWFRHLSLFGVSSANHGRSLPPALLEPAIAIAALFLLVPPSAPEVAAAVAILAIAFVCSVELLAISDRPIRREFGFSGVGLLRPLLEHISVRDPQATRQLEQFFGRKAIEADLKVTLVAFDDGDRRVATIALPTVHPGPFAAVGASDLPRKIATALGPEAGMVFVPHTPCNHDLDLPGEAEVDRIRTALKTLSAQLVPARKDRASPLTRPTPGAITQAQLLGDTVLALISQAPASSDDIDYAIIAPYYDRTFAGEKPVVAFIDCHNSYYNDTGDITFGSPAHGQITRDLPAAVEGAIRSARDGPIRVGVAARGGYTVGRHGIGPEGIRALVIDAAGSRTAYVLIDANNLLIGLRQTILEGLRGVVDAAEVMTTDNHVVHEVDGSVNILGERYPVEQLARDVREVVESALGSLRSVRVSAGQSEVPAVRVLGPGYTARLLTSLGDTLSVFANSAAVTFSLLVAASIVVVALLQ